MVDVVEVDVAVADPAVVLACLGAPTSVSLLGFLFFLPPVPLFLDPSELALVLETSIAQSSEASGSPAGVVVCPVSVLLLLLLSRG